MAVKMENFPEILNVVKCVAHSIPTCQLLTLIQNPRCASEHAIHRDCRLLVRPENIFFSHMKQLHSLGKVL